VACGAPGYRDALTEKEVKVGAATAGKGSSSWSGGMRRIGVQFAATAAEEGDTANLHILGTAALPASTRFHVPNNPSARGTHIR
jgi:hypothetical protein